MVADTARAALGNARLMLLFTPSLSGARDPLDALDAALDFVDVVQVRVKHPEHPAGAAPAAELYRWTEAFVIANYFPEQKRKRRLVDWRADDPGDGAA